MLNARSQIAKSYFRRYGLPLWCTPAVNTAFREQMYDVYVTHSGYLFHSPDIGRVDL